MTSAGMWYHLSQFYSEAELGPAYAKVCPGWPGLQRRAKLAASSCSQQLGKVLKRIPLCFPCPFSLQVATSTALAQVVGAPLAAGILALDGLGGLRGWQWLFLLEGERH